MGLANGLEKDYTADAPPSTGRGDAQSNAVGQIAKLENNPHFVELGAFLNPALCAALGGQIPGR